MIKRIFIASLFFLLYMNYHINAQKTGSNLCGTDLQMQKLYQDNPNSKLELLHFNKIKKAQKVSNNSYTIPVIFHVFGTEYNDETTVNQDIIEDALRKTNEDFQGLTADYGTVRSTFNTIKSTLKINFKLAKKDPDGNSTTGVVFYAKASGMGNYDSPIVPNVAWDNKKYVNVYITRDLYNDGDFYNSGVAWLPDISMTNRNIARIVYNGSYLGNNTNENFRSVLTHEFGHFLGLHHTFYGGCTSNGAEGDEVADTPPQEENSSGEGCFGRLNCLSEQINIENFMDYSDCYKMFTKGQVDRMINFLENSEARNTLWSDQNLIDTGLQSTLGVDDSGLSEVEVYPNPSKGILNILLTSNLNAEITISNLIGQTIYKSEETPKNQVIKLNLEDFYGIYILRVNQENKTSFKKIIIE